MEPPAAEMKSGKSPLGFNQSTWRKLGVVSILGAMGLAVYSVLGGILRDSMLHVAGQMLDEKGDISEPSLGGWFCLGYWVLFACFVMSALYLAIVDVRFIRLQYALERQQLFRERMNDVQAKPESGENEAEEH